MQVGSTRAAQALNEALNGALAGDVDGAALGAELYSIAQLLDAQPALRRALTEPSVDVEARSGLAKRLLAGKVSDSAVEVVSAAVEQRWSRVSDLAHSLEEASVAAAAAHADKAGSLDAVEDQLFRFGRILASNPKLRDALSDRTTASSRRRALVDGLLDGKAIDVTRQLIGQLVGGRHRTLSGGLAEYQRLAASRRERLVATVWVAASLSEEHQERLAQSLAHQYGHDVHLNVVVDPSVLGGVRVSIGDDIIDSTIESRLAKAERLVR